MGRKFVKLTKQRIGQLRPGERLSEHGIEYERLPDMDGVFRINVMVGGKRVHRTLGRTSDGVTPHKAWEWTSELRVKAAQERLGLGKGRKTHMMFNEAARRYLDELARSNGKDLKEKNRRLSLHLIPFLGRCSSQISTALMSNGTKRNDKMNPRCAVGFAVVRKPGIARPQTQIS